MPLGVFSVEENVSSEVTEYSDLRRDDIREDAVAGKVDEPQSGSHDVESVSSGSSIELLDMSDEVQDHAAAESPATDDIDVETAVELPSDEDRQGEREVSGGRDAEEFTNISQSSTDHSNIAMRSESSTYDSGKVQNVLAAVKLDNDGTSDAVDAMLSETVDRSVTDNGDEGNIRDQVAETDKADECQQIRHEDVLQQSAVILASMDRTDELETYTDNMLSETSARFDLFSRSVSSSSSSRASPRLERSHFHELPPSFSVLGKLPC